MKYNKYIGYVGLVVLMVTVTLDGGIQRWLWLISALFLFTYSLLNKDIVNSLVNGWIALINIWYLAV